MESIKSAAKKNGNILKKLFFIIFFTPKTAQSFQNFYSNFLHNISLDDCNSLFFIAQNK